MEAKDLINQLTNELASENYIGYNQESSYQTKDFIDSGYKEVSRAEKVANLKVMLKAGIYEVSSKEIAKKLLKMLF